MQDRNEMDNRRMQERDRERERDWNRESGYPRYRESGEFRDRPERDYSFQRRRDEDEGYMGGQRSGSTGWGSQSGYSQGGGYSQSGSSRRYENDRSSYGRDFENQYGQSGNEYENRGQQQWREPQWRESQWREPQFGSQSSYGGDFGRRQEDFGRWRDWNSQQQNRGTSSRYAGGMSTYGGGLSEFGERGRFSGRGPKGYQRADERIREDVCERLTHHSDVDASEIEIKVSNGEVTLTGSVDDRNAKRVAEEIAEQVSGVRDVHNQIRVQQQTASVGHGMQSGQSTAGQQNKKS
jgi:osmotically-inducible protein OsmY